MRLTDKVFGINSSHLKDPKVVPEVFEMYDSLTTASLRDPGSEYRSKAYSLNQFDLWD